MNYILKLLFILFILLNFKLFLLGDDKSFKEIDFNGSDIGSIKFLDKIKDSKKAHVAFLGGSITENRSGHFGIISRWLEKECPKVDFKFINAGLSSTSSVDGATRFNKDVLSKKDKNHNIDLLIVEFSVNDFHDGRYSKNMSIRGLEGIIRQYLQDNSEGNIIIVNFVSYKMLNVIKKGRLVKSSQASFDLAKHYNIPIVDVGIALSKEIDKKTMTWKEDYHNLHPNVKGYKFASDLIIDVIKNVKVKKSKISNSLNKISFSKVKVLYPNQLKFKGGWKYEKISRGFVKLGKIRKTFLKDKALRSETPQDLLSLTFKGNSLNVFALAGPDAGSVDVSLDDGDWYNVNFFHPHISKQLNLPRTIMLCDNLEDKYHNVKLRVSNKKHPTSKGNAITILYFGVSNIE